jgi:hypothetical protein
LTSNQKVLERGSLLSAKAIAKSKRINAARLKQEESNNEEVAEET